MEEKIIQRQHKTSFIESQPYMFEFEQSDRDMKHKEHSSGSSLFMLNDSCMGNYFDKLMIFFENLKHICNSIASPQSKEEK